MYLGHFFEDIRFIAFQLFRYLQHELRLLCISSIGIDQSTMRKRHNLSTCLYVR